MSELIDNPHLNSNWQALSAVACANVKNQDKVSLSICQSYERIIAPTIFKLNQKVKNLLELLGEKDQSIRRKRGLANFVGEASKFLFGTLDSDDAAYYDEQIRKFSQREETIMQLLKRETHIVQSTLSDINKTMAHIELNEKNLHDSLVSVAAQVDYQRKQMIQLITAERLSIYYNSFSTLLSIYQSEVEDLIQSIYAAKVGQLHPSVITPAILSEELNKAVPYLPPGTKFCSSLEVSSIHKLLSTFDMHVYYSKRNLVYIIDIPLVSLNSYRLYHLIPLPSKQNDNNLFLYIEPSHEFILIDDAKQHYLSFNEGQLSRCKKFGLKKICKQEQPILSSHIHETCEMKLFTYTAMIPKNCQTKLIHLNSNLWYQLYDQNVWLYTIISPEHVVINCRNETTPFNVQLTGSGLFKLHSACKAFTSQSELQPHETSFSLVHLNYLPPLDLNFDICLNKTTFNNTDFSLYVPSLYSIHDYRHLDLASKSLKEVSDLVDQAERNSSYNTYHYSFMFYVIIIVIVLFIVYKCIHCYYKKCKNLGIDESRIRNRNSIINNIISNCCRKKPRRFPTQIQMDALRKDFTSDLTSDDDDVEQKLSPATTASTSSGSQKKEFTPRYK